MVPVKRSIPTTKAPSAPSFRPVVVIPTYNNAHTLMDVIERAERAQLPLIVVDDGSTDQTPALLANWKGRGFVITHDRNQGKAAALQTAFAFAKESDFTHAITLDSDGQLAPEQIEDFVEAARSHPYDFIIGNRNDQSDDYPARSRIGRRLQNLAVRVQCGATIGDTLCGYRAYPLDMFDVIRVKSGGFAFEIEVVTRAVWSGFHIRDIPIRCLYFTDEKRVSHYRFFRDWTHALLVHIYLLFRRLIPLPVRQGAHVSRRQKVDAFVVIRNLIWWLRPDVLWFQARKSHLERAVLGGAIGLGAFSACLPAFGIQIALGLYFAVRLHAGSFLSVGIGMLLLMSPIGLALHIAAFWVGHIILLGLLPMPADLSAALTPDGVTILVLLRWLIGGIVVGGALGTVVGCAMNGLMSWIPYNRKLRPSAITAHS